MIEGLLYRVREIRPLALEVTSAQAVEGNISEVDAAEYVRVCLDQVPLLRLSRDIELAVCIRLDVSIERVLR